MNLPSIKQLAESLANYSDTYGEKWGTISGCDYNEAAQGRLVFEGENANNEPFTFVVKVEAPEFD